MANALLQTVSGLQAGDRAAVMQALALPVFRLPPEQTLQILTGLQYIRSANIATSETAAEALSQGDHRRRAAAPTVAAFAVFRSLQSSYLVQMQLQPISSRNFKRDGQVTRTPIATGEPDPQE